MTTNQPFDEGYDNTVRAVMRPTPPPSPSGKLRVANLYCGTGILSLAAQEAGMEVVYAHDTSKRARTSYGKKIGLEPDDGKLPDFTTIPAFDIVLATLPKDDIEGAIGFVLRFLRVRRPDTFILVGPTGENEQAIVTLVREKTRSLGYQIASGADTLLGIYDPNPEKDDPVAVGLLYLDPIRIPLSQSTERTSTVTVMLEQVAQTFSRPARP